ncbi:MAG: VWA domain-containing protein [Burkholderiaceae bacterium]
MKLLTSKAASSAFIALFLVGCGGGGDGNSGGGGGGGDDTKTKTILGQLVMPQASTVLAAKTQQALKARTPVTQAVDPACPNVPDGYQPIANTSVDILDADGKKIDSLTTDNCGAFDTKVAEAAVSLTVTPAGHATLTSSLAIFNSSTATASAMPVGASLAISSIQYTGNGSLAFSVTDSVTNKAVLGLTQAAISVFDGQTQLPIQSFGNAIAAQEPASVALVLDASGSMYDMVTTDYSRFNLASAAAHLFLNGKHADDEVAAVIFDAGVSPIDDAFLATQKFLDGGGNPVSFTISANGFTQDVKKLRVVADMYNPDSKMWGDHWPIDRHPDNPYTVDSWYPWGGSTALWAAAAQGVDMVAAQSNKRKLVVAMTDGMNNQPPYDSTALIDKAKQAGIPVHMIAFGEEYSVDEDAMKEVALQTGGEYHRRADASIADLFTSIQTGIRHQYTLKLANTVAASTILRLKVSLGGDSVEREVTAN